MSAVQRGEIWLVNLDPTVGSEIRKSRPCVVVSPPELHDHLRTVIVAPMTSKGFAAPFRVPVTHAGTKGLILLDQVRTVDQQRLAKRLGTVPAKTLGAALACLREVFSD
ncbi:MAG: type II toxin-antitoxin system PemK/MazF family toxin [Comamonas sp.]